MTNRDKRVSARSQRLTLAKLTPPDWFGWSGVVAMLLLPTVRINLADGPWFFPLLSLGEWLLMPLGVCSIVMGFLSLTRIREKTLLPLWISAIVPAALWLAAMGLTIANSGFSSVSGDLMVSWSVHLIFPTMVFLPLFPIRIWRNRLMWALAIGLVLNAVMIFWQGRAAGVAPPNNAVLGLGGFFANQHDYGLMLGIALPLLAAWRGGSEKKNAFVIMVCTFLLPVLTLTACFTASGYIGAIIGLIIAWAAWRSHAWLLGFFLCLAVFGYGSGAREEQDRNQRRVMVNSVSLAQQTYRRALNVFQVRPFMGSGADSFIAGTGHEPTGSITPTPWYATLLGGSGLLGLGMWLVLLGELAARTMGRFGRRCLWHGGVLGGTVAAGVAGLWTDAMPEGAGAMVGILIALSILEEPEPAPPPKRAGRKNKSEETSAPAPVAAAPEDKPGRGGDTDIIKRA